MRQLAGLTVRIVSLALLLFVVTGCSSIKLGVEPWERDILAQKDMQLSTIDARLDDHIYYSKEATSGGRSYGGGGCGCN